MIKYILKCNKGHEFESWFSNSEEFEKLNKKNFSSVFSVHQNQFLNQ